MSRVPTSQNRRKTETVASAKAHLQSLLYSCTETALRGFTVDRLAGTHNVAPKEVEYMLIIARQKRLQK